MSLLEITIYNTCLSSLIQVSIFLIMKIYSRTAKIIISVVCIVLGFVVFSILLFWTDSIRSQQRQGELRQAMQDVVSNYGEKGLLEMAGVPVNDIYYGDSGITLFQGDEKAWNYSADELVNISVFEKTQSAVIHISTEVDSSVSSFLDVSKTSGIGSGFFISYDGYICTNHHVIEGAKTITVTDSEGTNYTAELVGVDSENDIAVIKVTPQDSSKVFNYLEFEDSDNLVVGQKVLAIGNPFGYDRSMVTGIISGLSRPIRNEQGQILLGMIQTDAPINPGNSGGPLLNTRGKVIGINSAIYSTSGTNQGMNFAVASNTARDSSQDLIKYGKINRGWLDIVPVQLSEEIVKYANLKVSKGILVSQTSPFGKAEKAGIKGGNQLVRYGNSMIYIGGDVITKVNGIDVSEYSDLFTALSNTRPSDKVDVVVYRNGQNVQLKVELVERNAENVGWINR